MLAERHRLHPRAAVSEGLRAEQLPAATLLLGGLQAAPGDAPKRSLPADSIG